MMKLKNIVQNIFSIKNENVHKILCVIGLKIKFKNKNNYLSNMITNIFTEMQNTNYRLYYLQKSNIEAAHCHPQIFNKFKNIHANKIGVAVGCGPTLNFYKPIKNAIHGGVNRSFLKSNINLDYLFIGDMFQDEENLYKADNYNKETCKKFYVKASPNLQKYFIDQGVTQIHIDNAKAERVIVSGSWNSNWSIDISNEPIQSKTSSIFFIIQFLIFCGISKIYLVGCDCSDKGHFYKKAFLGETTDLSYQYSDYLSFKEHINRNFPNVEIISINSIGLKGIFKDVYTKEFLQNNKELNIEKVELLEGE